MKKIKHFLDLDQINAEELRSIVDLSKESPLRSKKEDVVEIDSDAPLSERKNLRINF